MLLTAHMVLSVQRPTSCASVASDVKEGLSGGLRESTKIKSWGPRWACTCISGSTHRHQPSCPALCWVTPAMNQIHKLAIPSVARVCVTQRKPGAMEGHGWPQAQPEGQGRSWPVLALCQQELLGFSIARGEPSENVHPSSLQKLFLGPAGATEKGRPGHA